MPEVIDQLDLSRLSGRYRGCGSAAYHPSVLLVYGYARGVFSSRKMERATYDSVAFRFVSAGTQRDHDTLADFRKTFLVELEDLFVQVLSLAQAMQLVKLGQIALDGTKIKAHASKHKALSHGHIEKLEHDTKVARREAQRQARNEPEGGGTRNRAEGRRGQINLTDEESRILPSHDSFIQGYKSQAAVAT